MPSAGIEKAKAEAIGLLAGAIDALAEQGARTDEKLDNIHGQLEKLNLEAGTQTRHLEAIKRMLEDWNIQRERDKAATLDAHNRLGARVLKLETRR